MEGLRAASAAQLFLVSTLTPRKDCRTAHKHGRAPGRCSALNVRFVLCRTNGRNTRKQLNPR